MAKVAFSAFIEEEEKQLIEGFANTHGDIGLSGALRLLLTKPNLYIDWLEKTNEKTSVKN